MKKADRQALVKELLDDGVEENEIIIEVTTQSGASEATVKKDIKELSEDAGEAEENGVIVKVIELSEREKDNKELAKGRKTQYEVQEKDQSSVHVELEQVQVSAGMVKTSKPHVAKLDPKQWDKFRKQIVSLGYDHYRILYYPEGMTEEQLEIPVPKKESEDQ